MITENEIRIILNDDKNKDDVCIEFSEGCFKGKELNHIKAAKAIIKELTWESNKAIADLVRENIELKKTIEGFRKGYADLNDYSDKLKSKLASIKTLDNLEVHAKIWELLGEVNCQAIFIDQDENGEYIQNEETARLDMCVTAICNLAYKIDKDIVVKALLENSAIEEIELKNGDKVSYRVLGQAGFEIAADQILKDKEKKDGNKHGQDRS